MNCAPKIHLLSLSLAIAACLLATDSTATIIVDDSWADGGLDDGADPLDSNWWTSSSSSGIEVSVGSLGLVTGTSGRGIHTIFPSQTLAVGDSITATLDFATPATVGTGKGTAFRIGLFDDLGRAVLNGNVSASSGTPNPAAYDILPGYAVTLDVGTGDEDINFREHNLGGSGSGRLLSTTSNFDTLSSGGDPYSFAPNTDYTAVYKLTKTSATDMELMFTLSNATGVLSTFTDTDDSLSAESFAMLAVHANSNVFGSDSSGGEPDNGIDFSNITIEVNAIPEPSTAILALGSLVAMARFTRRR